MQTIKEKITDEYLDRIYYFSLKKTSSTDEAEDLTQEIMLEAIQSLENGSQPDDPGAWIWKIARNRYARWAERRAKSRRNIAIDDMSDELADNSSVSDDIIHREEVALLRRELSLLTHDYRSILCEYYFRNRTISEIAAITSYSPGTIKRKLYESRQNIKEGMKMSRTYGTRSFSPDNIVFTQNWDPSTGRGGHRLIEKLIPQNILLEAYDNPCTAEELSLALGVAMPYMEDEIGTLVENGLLIKDGGKYKTGIVILSKSAQEKLYDIGEKIADRLTPVIRAAVDEISENNPDLPQAFEKIKPMLVEKLCSLTCGSRCRIHTIRHSDGSEWALMGLEKCDKNAESLEVWWKDGLGQVIMLGNRTDTEHLEIAPSDIPVFSQSELNGILKTSNDSEIKEVFNEYASLRDKVLEDDIPGYLIDTALFGGNIDFRYLVMNRLIDEGYIALDADMNKSAMGVYNITND